MPACLLPQTHGKERPYPRKAAAVFTLPALSSPHSVLPWQKDRGVGRTEWGRKSGALYIKLSRPLCPRGRQPCRTLQATGNLSPKRCVQQGLRPGWRNLKISGLCLPQCSLQPSDLGRMQSSRVKQWKTYTQTDRQAQWDTQTGSKLEPV